MSDLTFQRLGRSFFEGPPWACAESLVGIRLRWHGRGGIIVETEAYAAAGDEACHTAKRPSARKFLSCQPPGAAYVYFNYGMHWMLNVRVGLQHPGFVLIRAIEPDEGLPSMREARQRTKATELCSGPGKLAQALGVEGNHHGLDLCLSEECGFWGPARLCRRLRGPRIGISAAQDLPWRFWEKDNPHVSNKQKTGQIKKSARP